MNTAIPTVVMIQSGFTLIALGLGAALAPRVSRPDIFFSVTVDPSLRDSAAGREIHRNFNLSVILSTLAGLAVIVAAIVVRQSPIMAIWLAPVACAVQWIGIVKSYLTARQRALAHQVAPSTEREAALAPRPRFAGGSWLAELGPFLILAFFALWLGLHWDRIPVRFPIHWGMAGRPDGWSDRTLRSVFALPIIGAITCAFIALLAHALARGVRRVHSGGPEGQKESRNLRNVGRLMLGIEYWFAILFGAMGLLPFAAKNGGSPVVVPLIAIFSGLVSVVLVIVAMRMGVKSGQGGWRLSDGNKSLTTAAHAAPAGDRTPDACWKAGVIYYNPNDPAVWVEKRFGYGWTLNFGSHRALIIMGAILLFGLAMPILSLFLFKK